jgi:haloacetate dehalogenase
MTIDEKYFPGFAHQVIHTGEVDIQTWVGGHGDEAVLLLHGHPESHLTWFRVAPELAKKYTVVITDMRGYGDSSKPHGNPDHSTYSKRSMAKDQVFVMQQLGFDKFHIVGHDRGARVCHRLLLDYPDLVKSATLIDIIPTLDVYEMTTQAVATKFWHWYFYIQKEPFPETFLGARPEYFIRSNIQKKTIPGTIKKDTFPEDIVDEYIRYYSDPATVHAIAEDYRASVTVDWDMDLKDREHKFSTPLLCLWGSDGNVGRLFDVTTIWKKIATDVTGFAAEGCGHFVPEEKAAFTVEKITAHIEKNK